MDADLQRLSPGAFQSLAAGLTVAVFGPSTVVLGDGRDGGRDMYLHGPLTWQVGQADAEQWDGYTVFQVKQKDTLSDDATVNASWLWGEVKKELDRWAKPEGDRNPLPDQLVFITNVPLTPFPEAGGHDQIRTNLKNYRDALDDGKRDVDEDATVTRVRRRDRIKQINRVEFWDGNQLQALLTVYGEVRRRFDAFLTASDIFSVMSQFTDVVPPGDGESALLDHARTELSSDGLVYFDQAGSRDNRGIPVHEVAIDLPLTFPAGGKRTTVLRHVLQRGELVLAKDITSHRGPRHIVITGQPGNGKSTVSQLIVQAYRAAGLKGSTRLAAAHESIIAGTEAVLRRLGHEMPRSHRWPIKVNLAKYAEERGQVEDETLLRYLADKISHRSQVGRITPAALNTWLHRWPWLVVLDGLDEVTEPNARRRIIERVIEFANNAEGDNADVLIVLTTRPMGYTEDIEPALFETVSLDDLTPDEAVRYGVQAARVRIGDHADRLEKVESALRAAARDDNMAKLLRTPLQVLILSIIIDGAGQVEPDRYSLFWNYYDTVFRRERDKTDALRSLLNTYGGLIQQLHEHAGFQLQSMSERGDQSNATLDEADIRTIAWQVLTAADYKPETTHADVLDEIVKAAMDRLVLLAPRGDGLGFDVRSLQELMAALYLMNAPFEAALRRLQICAPSPHWRNTWLFAAGKLFFTPEPHAHQRLVELVEAVDIAAPDRLGTAVPIGPRLALDIIEDGMARGWPHSRRKLLAHGLKVLNEPRPPDLYGVTRTLLRYADAGAEERAEVSEGLRRSLRGDVTTRATADKVLELIPELEPELRVRETTLGLGLTLPDAGHVTPQLPVPDWDLFDTEIYTAPASADEAAILMDASVAIRTMRSATPTAILVEAIQKALASDSTASVLEQGLAHVARGEPSLLARLRDDVLPDAHRRSVAHRLAAAADS